MPFPRSIGLEMVDVDLKFIKNEYSEHDLKKLSRERQDFVVGDSDGLTLFDEEDVWYSLTHLWGNQVRLQKDRQIKIAYGELCNVMDKLWLIGALGRNRYDL